jgi:hypothetical protein
LAGNASAMTAAFNLSIDQTAPNAVTALTLNGSPNAELTKTATLALSGTAEAGSRIWLRLNGQALTMVTAHASTGAWSYTGTSVLADGPHNLSLQVEDAAGNLGVLRTHLFQVDTVPPLSPVVTGMSVATDSGISSTDRLTRHTLPVFNGTAEPPAPGVVKWVPLSVSTVWIL